MQTLAALKRYVYVALPQLSVPSAIGYEAVLCVQVRYRIEDTLSGRFRVDEESGVIFTRGSFDNLDGQRLTLMVTNSISRIAISYDTLSVSR